MQSSFRSSQRGFVRHVGMTPSRRDRQNKRDPAVHNLPPEKSEQQIELEWLQAEHPEQYEQALAFARYFEGLSEAERVDLMVTHIRKAVAAAAEEQRHEQLLADYEKSRA
jgi:hypothetical protein